MFEYFMVIQQYFVVGFWNDTTVAEVEHVEEWYSPGFHLVPQSCIIVVAVFVRHGSEEAYQRMESFPGNHRCGPAWSLNV